MKDPLALANLAVSTATAITTIYIALLALKHTATPRLQVVCHTLGPAPKGKRYQLEKRRNTFGFEIFNIGHWYGHPAAVNVVAEIEFPNSIENIQWQFCILGNPIPTKDNVFGAKKSDGLVVRTEPFTLHAGESKRLYLEGTFDEQISSATGPIYFRATSENRGTLRREYLFEYTAPRMTESFA